MPLVRYEVRCEHSLASPELYRFVGQDDSQGLLEGVAMAGLVGVVRQLGDLTELATGIFHDLYDDIITIASRGKDLKARVACLEADLSLVEKALHAEARSKWRAPLPMDQNLYVHGRLPRFIRNFYDDCQFPPRLFLLDPFDEAGQGACLKRYSDPTFFRITWATAQKKAAEEAKLGRQAEQDKRTSANKPFQKPGPLIYPRDRLSSSHFENVEGFTSDLAPDPCSQQLDWVLQIPIKGDLTPEKTRSLAKHGSPEDESCYVDASTTTSRNVDFEARLRSPFDVHNRVDSKPDSHNLVAPDPEQVAFFNPSVLRVNVKYNCHKLPPQGIVKLNQSNDLNIRPCPEEHQKPKFHFEDPDSPLECEASTEITTVQHGNDNPQEAYCSSEGAGNELNITSCTNGETRNLVENVHKSSPKLVKLRHKPPEKPLYQSHPSISLQDVQNAPTRVQVREQGVSAEGSGQFFKPDHEVLRALRQHSQLILARTDRIVSIPNSSSICARDSDLRLATCSISSRVSPLELNSGIDFTGCVEGSMSEDGLHSQEIQSLRGIVPHGEAHVEQKVQMSCRTGHNDLFCASSSNVSNSYSNIASSSAVEDDGYTSSASESSMKGTNVSALLSPPDSPPRKHCVMMGSANSYSANSQLGRDGPKAPIITPSLSRSPTESRSSSMKHEPLGSVVDELFGTHFEEASLSQLLPEGDVGSLSPQASDGPVADWSHVPIAQSLKSNFKTKNEE
uniref:Protein SCAR n=1 Tax=Physcomitrium patens TaxID=3218 RepID=A0A7I4ATB6_PHYPA